MCTLSACCLDGGWLITMNRDERRDRAEGVPPFLWQAPVMLAPQDPQAHGTWMAVRHDGMWACLLNGYLPDQDGEPIQHAQSRGRIIPAIFGQDDPNAVMEQIDLAQTDSFRLWLWNNQVLTEYFWDRQRLAIQAMKNGPWFFTTSSSYHQHAVTQQRRGVFQAWLREGAQQNRYGMPLLHIDPMGLSPDHAVCMRRDYSHTKSITQFEISNGSVTGRHWQEGGFHDAPATCQAMAISALQ